MRLLSALQLCENRLCSWKRASDTNTRIFHENPAAALEAADLRLDVETMVELETVLRDLARKLELALPDRVA
ncbi:MAG TPA: hypothetical protein VFR84_02240 [Candidatus Angelobacter sp.]|nr:hypothetical protein [Candidatus Angelobacter sp.]